ncbi:hypothetical protein ACFL1S_04615 [Pseudomonadota bacterium]
MSSLLGSPLEGIYYPLASGWLKSVPADWTNKPWFAAPLYLLLFSGIWILFLWKEGALRGARLASLFSAFLVAPFWIISAVTTDMYDLRINPYWLASMIYTNISFFFFAFFGDGHRLDL